MPKDGLDLGVDEFDLDDLDMEPSSKKSAVESPKKSVPDPVVKAEPVTKKVEQKVTTPAKAPESNLIADEDSEIPGVTKIEFGKKIDRFPFPKFRAAADRRTRIAILSLKYMVALKVHFDEQNGSYLCFDGECCDVSGYPRIKYCVPVVVYDTDANGKPISEKIDIAILALGDEKYQDLINLNDEFPLNKHDLIVSCSDEKYQKNTFQASNKESTWKTFAGAKELVAKWYAKQKDAWKCIAKHMSSESLKLQKAAPADKPVSKDDGGTPDLDDVIVDD